MSNSLEKLDQPESGASSDSSQGTNVGFYEKYCAVRNVVTPRPSFLEESEISLKQDDTRAPNTSSIPSLTSAFGTLKRKRIPDVIEKPSFKVSSFVDAPPHLPKFGMSLNTAKFNFATNSRSAFYSGRTTFGGSSSCREDSAKRIKILPVSNCAHTNTTKVSAKPYSDIPYKRTLSSKTAENILKTLNEMCTPIEQPGKKQPYVSDISSSYLSLSKRLREKRETKNSVFQTPIQRVNQIQSINGRNTNVNTYIGAKETELVERSDINSENGSSTENISTKFSILKTSKEDIKQYIDNNSQSVVKKPSLKMKRQRITPHYSTTNKNEEPVNTMPEVTSVQPLIVTSLPTFEISVKNEKPLFKHVENKNNDEYNFSTPKAVTDKKLDCESIDTKYIFISPIPIKNNHSATPTKISEVRSINTAPPSTMPIQFNCFKGLVNKESINICETETTVSTNTTAPGIDYNVDSKLNKISKIHPVPSGPKIALLEEGSWECPTRMIVNKPDITKCAACTEPKPGSNKAEQSVKSSFSFGQPVDDSTKSSFTFGKTSAIPSAGFKFASPEEGSWECPTCMIVNKPDITKCAACTEAKPGSNKAEQSIKSSFSFGQPMESIAKSKKESMNIQTSSLSFELAPEGKSFGKQCNDSNVFPFVSSTISKQSSGFSLVSTVSSVPSGFSFVSATTSNGSSGFTFVNSANSATSTAEFANSVSSVFSFGINSATSTANFANSGSSTFSFGKSDSVPGNKPVTFPFSSDSKTSINELQDKSSNIFREQNTCVDHKIENGFTTKAEKGFAAESNNANTTTELPATNVFTASSSIFKVANVNGTPTTFLNNTSSPSSLSFNFAHSSVPSFMLNSNDTKPSSAPPNKFNFNSDSLSTSNFKFGAASLAASNANTSGPFNFGDNNVTACSGYNKNEEPKATIFSHTSADTNLFKMGSGTTNIAQSNTFAGPERRKVRRAHRRLQTRKK